MTGFVRGWAERRLGWGALPAIALVGAFAVALALLPLAWAGMLVVGSIIAVLTLVRPQFGVLLLVPAVPFGSLRQVQVGVASVGLAEALLALVLAAWLMRLAAQRRKRIRIPPLAIPMSAFVGVLFLTLLGTTSVQHSFKELVKWVEVLALYVLVANEMEGRWARVLVFVVLATGALVALQGIYQFLFQVGPEEFVLFGRFMRAYGTFEQPNPYGGYLGLTLPLAVALVAAGLLRVRGKVSWPWILWALGSGGLMLAALMMSWSRGAWLGFGAAIGAMALVILVHSGRSAILGAAFAVLAGYVLVAGGLARIPGALIQRFSDFVPYMGVLDVRAVEVTDANFAVLERVAHWQSAVRMWADRPWLGVGIGNFEAVYARYALPLWPLALGHAHNYYLNIGAEAGVLGLIAYVLLWALALLVAWRAVRKLEGWWWGVALGVLGVITHLTVHNLFDNLYVHSMYLSVAILLGVIASNGKN